MGFSKLSRRDFLRSAALGAVGITFVPFSIEALASTGKSTLGDALLYRFVLLGDMHFDRPEHHDMDWVRKTHPNDVRQIEEYVGITRKNTPALLQRISQVIESSDVPVPFVLQVGDLVEGLCGNFELASKQFGDAIDLIQQSRLGSPFLMCKGNHDITGPGAADAYQKVLLPWVGKQVGQQLTSSQFSARYKDDVFLFFDAFQPNLDWVDAELARHRDARRTFFVLHLPVVPYNNRADWLVLAKKQVLRERLLQTLARRNAIVLSGHLHKYSVVEHQSPQGRFTQLAVCSVVPEAHPAVRDERIGVEAYGPELANLEPNFRPESREERKRILEAERPNIRRFEYADLPGFAVVDVYEAGVECRVFGGVDQKPYRSAPLTVGATV